MRKTAAALVLLAAASAVALAGCEEGVGDVPAIRDIKLTPSSVTLAPGETADLSVSITGSGDLGDVSVRWRTSASSVATVEPTGDGSTAEVTAQAPGSATITAEVVTSGAGVVRDRAEVTVTGG